MDDSKVESKKKKTKRKESKNNKVQIKPNVSEMFLEATIKLKEDRLSPKHVKSYILNQYNVDITQHLEDLNSTLLTRNSEINIRGGLRNKRQECIKRASKRKQSRTAHSKKKQKCIESSAVPGCSGELSNLMNEFIDIEGETETDYPKVTLNFPYVRNKKNDNNMITGGNTSASYDINTKTNDKKIEPCNKKKDFISRLSTNDTKYSHNCTPVDKKPRNGNRNDGLQAESAISKAGSAVKSFIEDLGTKCASSLTFLSRPFTNTSRSCCQRACSQKKNQTYRTKKVSNLKNSFKSYRDRLPYPSEVQSTSTKKSMKDENKEISVVHKGKLDEKTKSQRSKVRETNILKKVPNLETTKNVAKKEKPTYYRKSNLTNQSDSKTYRQNSVLRNEGKPTEKIEKLNESNFSSTEIDDNILNISDYTSDYASENTTPHNNEVERIIRGNNLLFENTNIVTRQGIKNMNRNPDKINEDSSIYDKECNKKPNNFSDTKEETVTLMNTDNASDNTSVNIRSRNNKYERILEENDNLLKKTSIMTRQGIKNINENRENINEASSSYDKECNKKRNDIRDTEEEDGVLKNSNYESDDASVNITFRNNKDKIFNKKSDNSFKNMHMITRQKRKKLNRNRETLKETSSRCDDECNGRHNNICDTKEEESLKNSDCSSDNKSLTITSRNTQVQNDNLLNNANIITPEKRKNVIKRNTKKLNEGNNQKRTTKKVKKKK